MNMQKITTCKLQNLVNLYIMHRIVKINIYDIIYDYKEASQIINNACNRSEKMQVTGMFQSADNIFMSLERRMKCGVGKCGHCQINHSYVCQDGPVYNYLRVKELEEAI